MKRVLLILSLATFAAPALAQKITGPIFVSDPNGASPIKGLTNSMYYACLGWYRDCVNDAIQEADDACEYGYICEDPDYAYCANDLGFCFNPKNWAWNGATKTWAMNGHARPQIPGERQQSRKARAIMCQEDAGQDD